VLSWSFLPLDFLAFRFLWDFLLVMCTCFSKSPDSWVRTLFHSSQQISPFICLSFVCHLSWQNVPCPGNTVRKPAWRYEGNIYGSHQPGIMATPSQTYKSGSWVPDLLSTVNNGHTVLLFLILLTYSILGLLGKQIQILLPLYPWVTMTNSFYLFQSPSPHL
jgi:hypothetical protein